MKLRALLLLALLALAASPVGAAVRYVTQSGRGTGTGADSSNAQSIANFNSNAVAGDVALLLGNFSTGPNPNNSGTRTAPIIYRSLSGRPNDVCITGGLSAGSKSDSNVVWRDLTVRGGIDLGAATENGRWQVRNVRVIDGGLSLTAARDCRIDSVYATNSQASTTGITVWYSTTVPCQRDTIRNSSFSVLKADGTGSTAINVFTGYDNFYEAMRCTVVTSTNSANSGLRFGRVCATVRGMMKDCYFVGTNNTSGGGADEPMCFSFKDGCANFRMYRDTIITRGNSNGAAPWISFGQSESWGAIGGNVFRNCYIRNESDATWGVIWNTGWDGDSLVGNTFAARNGVESYYDRGTAVSAGPTIVDHNVFASFSAMPALLMLNSGANQAVTFTNNIFYTPGLANSDSGGTRAVHFGTAGNWGSASVGPVGNDYNVAWAPGMTTKRLVQWTGGTSAFGMSPWLSARSPATLDPHSVTGPLKFADSTLATFDAHPLTGSGALMGPDGYVGPFDRAGAADVTPPGQVTSLAVSIPKPHSLTIGWLAPGNDGSTGTAAVYDIRMSTSVITAGNFASATAVPGIPTPAPAGTPQQVTVSALAPSTTYYFALMARDAAGNWSAMSLPAQGATTVDDVSPYIITDFRFGSQ